MKKKSMRPSEVKNFHTLNFFLNISEREPQVEVRRNFP